MNKRGLFYCMDKEITPGKLKKMKDLELPDLNYQKIQRFLEKEKINFLIDEGNEYHFKLKLFKSNPYILYYKGNINLLDNKILGIVGPRNASIYGQKVLESLFGYLEGQSLCTISGMAPGIDTVAHTLSIQCKIPTIAVLGGGMCYYQNQNTRYMMDKILDNGGLILSQFKLYFEPTNYSFPQRNRIIAGLSDVLFLPEAGIKSGSLITADFAIEMHKKVYGTPNGVFDDISAGINDYINKSKIIPINDISKFAEENFGEKQNTEIEQKDDLEKLTDEETKILKIISKFGQISIDEIANYSGKTISQIMIIITNLEINGNICEVCPGIYKIF